MFLTKLYLNRKVSYSCTCMRSKLIEVGMIFIYTNTIYVNIPYMEYMSYEENCDMIAYGVYLH